MAEPYSGFNEYMDKKCEELDRGISKMKESSCSVVELFVSGRIPSKKNSKVISNRGKRPVLLTSKKHREWHKSASFDISHLGSPKYTCYSVELHITFPDWRIADLTNKAESIMDLLVDNGIIIDDNWKNTGEVRLIPCGVDKEKAGCKIILRVKDGN